MNEFRKLLTNLQERPGSYFGHEPSSAEVFAFLLGYGIASDALVGFREFLLVKTNGQSNLTEETVLRRFLFPDASGALDQEQDRKLVSTLWELLVEFSDSKSEMRGLAVIYDSYIHWQNRQPGFAVWPIGSINQLERTVPAEPDSDDAAALKLHHLRSIALHELTVDDCLLLLSLRLHLRLIVSRSLELLREGKPTSSKLSQLHAALVGLGEDWWQEPLGAQNGAGT